MGVDAMQAARDQRAAIQPARVEIRGAGGHGSVRT
jgi:hypothetical protein